MHKILIFIALSLFASTTMMAKDKSNDYHFKYKKGKYYLINPEGKKVDCEPFTYAEPFSEGLAVVRNGLGFFYVDSIGHAAISTRFYDARPFLDGVACVAINGKYGFINKEGQFIIKPQFVFANSFKDGLAFVQKVNLDSVKYGETPYIKALINSKGNVFGGGYYSELYKSNEGQCYTAIKNDSIFHLSLEGELEFKELKGDLASQVADDLPEFPDGESGLRKFIAMNVRYPIRAQENSIQGRCYVSFEIDEEGNVINIRPARAAPPILIKESLRAVSVMPRWKPGIKNGKPIKVSYTVPVNFVLQ